MYSRSQPAPAKKFSAYDIYIQENIARREASRGRIHGYVPKNEPIPDNHFAHPYPQDVIVPKADEEVTTGPDSTDEPITETEQYDHLACTFRTLYKQPQSITDVITYSSVAVKIPSFPKRYLPVVPNSVTVFNCRAGPGSFL